MYRLFRQIAGFSRCRIDGDCAARLVMLCRHRHIYMWDIRRTKDGMEVSVLTPDIDALEGAAALCGARVTVLFGHGLPVILKKAAVHKYFFIGLLAAAVLMYVMSGRIWAVDVYGNSFYTDEVLLSYLKEIDAGAGSLKKNIVPSEVEENIRLKYPRISWVSAQITGTKLKLNIEEGQPEVTAPKENADEITAPYGGTVVSVMVRGGTPLVKAGDSVGKGDVLVRGSVDIYNDDGTVARTEPVTADADIILRVKFNVSKRYDRHYMKKVYDTAVSKRYIFEIFGKTIETGRAASGQKNGDDEPYDEVRTRKAFRLTKDFYLPFAVTKISRQSYKTEPAVYTKEAVTEIAMTDFERILGRLAKKGGKVIENNTETEVTDKCLLMSGYVIADMPCTVPS